MIRSRQFLAELYRNYINHPSWPYGFSSLLEDVIFWACEKVGTTKCPKGPDQKLRVAHPFEGVRGCQKDFPSVPFCIEPKIDLLLVISQNFNCPGQLDMWPWVSQFAMSDVLSSEFSEHYKAVTETSDLPDNWSEGREYMSWPKKKKKTNTIQIQKDENIQRQCPEINILDNLDKKNKDKDKDIGSDLVT